MSEIVGWVFSEQGLTALVGVLGTLYLLLKKKEINGVKIEWNRKVAFEALCVGVLEAFRRYVQELKEKDPNNQLDSEVEAKAHEMATTIATEVAKKKGVDLIATIGADYIDYNIKNIVEDMKAKGILALRKGKKNY